ncbi:MAG: hypothetical protein IH845_05210 [Nanoarchaeota archaeon]|nr:hypothetical protein [Nanoarchaeota archaeon]
MTKELTQEQINEQAEEQAEKQLKKTLKTIKDNSSTPLLEKIYSKPKEYTKMVANGNSRGFLLWGNTGLGKTFAVFRAFEEMNKEFVYLSGHITPLELYQFLFRNKDQNIVLDDVNILNDEINLNMLKSCLADQPSIVNYNTTSPRLKVPNKFHFEGTIILLLNSKPRLNEDLRAVEGRVLTHELKLSYVDVIRVLYEISEQEYKGLTAEQRKEIMKWLEENTNQATECLNLRTLFQLYEMYKFDKDNWKELAKGQIKPNIYMDLILQGINSWNWCEETGKSTATYYRYKKKAQEQKISILPEFNEKPKAKAIEPKAVIEFEEEEIGYY